MAKCERCGEPLSSKKSKGTVCDRCQKSWRSSGQTNKPPAEHQRRATENTLIPADVAGLNAPGSTIRPHVVSPRTVPSDSPPLSPENSPLAATLPPRTDNRPTTRGQSTLDTHSAKDTQAPRGDAANRATIRLDHTPDTIVDIPVRPRVLQTTAHSDLTQSDYQLLDRIGEGGMGVVYRARQNSVQRDVAIKQIKPTGARDAEQQSKFIREAQFTGELAHPNIVPIHDLGRTDDGTLFYAMKIVHGERWETVLKTKTRQENLEVLLSVCDAIAFAHSRHVIHRDIKPENVMLGDFGEVLVMDWGLAAKVGGSESNVPGGSPAYMAPEMAAEYLRLIGHPDGNTSLHRVDKYSDIYLLGAVLFEIVAGHPPHESDGRVGSQQMIMECLRNAAHNRIVEVDRQGDLLLAIAIKALSTEPDARFATVADFQSAIREYQEHAQSIGLVERADSDLATAMQSSGYEDYARALFGFQDALELWSANAGAIDGIRRTRNAYAQAALQAGDFELGLSVLKPQDETERKLYQRLERGALERQQRDRRVRVARLTTAAMLVVAAGAMAVGWYTTNRAKVAAESARQAANLAATKEREQRDKAEAASGQERIAKEKAIDAYNSETRAREEAQVARDEATRDKQIAERALEDVRRERFVADVSLAAQLVNHDPISAGVKLASLRQDEQEVARVAVDWEWQRLHYQTHPEVRNIPAGGGGARTSVTPDGRLAVSAAIDQGMPVVTVWNPTTQTAVRRMQDLPDTLPPINKVIGLAISDDGAQVHLGCNTGRNAKGMLISWNISDGQVVEARETFRGLENDTTYRMRHMSVSPDGLGLLTVHESRFFVRGVVWSYQAGKLTAVADWLHSSVDTMSDWRNDHFVYARLHRNDAQTPVLELWKGTRVTEAGKQQVDFQQLAARPPDNPITSLAVAPSLANESTSRIEVAEGRMNGAIIVSRFSAETDASSDGEQYRLFGHRARVTSICYSRDHQLLISADASGLVLVWDLDRRQVRQTLTGHMAAVESMQISDKEVLITADEDGNLRFWDLPNYHDQFEGLAPPGTQVQMASMSRDGTYVAVADDRGTVRIQAINGTTSPVEFTAGHLASDHVEQAWFDAESQRIVTWSRDTEDTLCIWDGRTGKRLRRGVAFNGSGLLALSRGGRYIATVTMVPGDKNAWSVRVLNVDTGTASPPVVDRFEEVTAVTMVGDSQQEGRYVALGYSSGTVRLLDLMTAKELARNRADDRGGGPISQILAAEDRRSLITIGENNKAYQLCEWTFDATRSTQVPEASQTVVAAEIGKPLHQLWRTVWSKDQVKSYQSRFKMFLRGNSLYVARIDPTLAASDDRLIFRTLDGARGFQQPMDTGAFEAAVVGPIRDLAVSGRDHVCIVNAQGELISWSPTVEPQHHSWSLRPGSQQMVDAGEGRLLVIGDGLPQVCDVKSGAVLRRFGGRVVALGWLQQDERLATLNEDGTIRVWNARTGELAQQLVTNEGAFITQLKCRHGEAQIWGLVRAGEMNQLTSWDSSLSEPTASAMATFAGDVVSLQALNDLPALLLADHQLRIERGRESTVYQLQGLDDVRVTCMDLSAETLKLVVGGNRGEAFLFDLPREATGANVETSGSLAPRFRVPSQRQVPVPVTAVTFSPSGNRVVTGDAAGGIRMWFFPETDVRQTGETEIQQAKELLSIPGHARSIQSIEFSAGQAPSLMTANSTGYYVWFASAMETPTEIATRNQ